MKQRVIFAFMAWNRHRGATVLRTKQLSQILNEHYGGRYQIERVPIRRPRFAEAHNEFVAHANGAVVIGLMHALRPLGRDRLLALRQRSAGLCMDHVDSAPDAEDLGLYHVHIVASQSGYRRVNSRLAKYRVSSASVAHVTHHADLRIQRLGASIAAPFRIGYLGNPKKMIKPPNVNDVEVLSYENQSDFKESLYRFGTFPIHYAVRPKTRNPEISKPFTKGFTAAAMGANILVNKQVDDAEFYLGTDYPYLLKSSRSQDIEAGLEHARVTYGGAEWKSGLETIEHVRHLSSPRFVAAELHNAIETAQAMASTI